MTDDEIRQFIREELREMRRSLLAELDAKLESRLGEHNRLVMEAVDQAEQLAVKVLKGE